MNEQEKEAVLALCILAAYADGRRGENERAEIKSIAESIGHKGLTSIYLRIESGELSLENAAALLTTPELRREAYAAIISICAADNHLAAEEEDFLRRAGDALGLSGAEGAALRRRLDSLLRAEPDTSAAPASSSIPEAAKMPEPAPVKIPEKAPAPESTPTPIKAKEPESTDDDDNLVFGSGGRPAAPLRGNFSSPTDSQAPNREARSSFRRDDADWNRGSGVIHRETAFVPLAPAPSVDAIPTPVPELSPAPDAEDDPEPDGEDATPSAAAPTDASESARNLSIEKLILRHASVCAALEYSQRTYASLSILPLQRKLVARLANRYGLKITRRQVNRLLLVLDISDTTGGLRTAAGRAISHIAGSIGFFLSAPGVNFTPKVVEIFATTYGLGQAACLYFSENMETPLEEVERCFRAYLNDKTKLFEKHHSEVEKRLYDVDIGDVTYLQMQK